MVNDFEKINLKMATMYRLMAFKSFLIYDAPSLYPEGWLSPGFKAIKCLRIMTYHQSKGLEYPVVFMPFLTKHSIFPQKTRVELMRGVYLMMMLSNSNMPMMTRVLDVCFMLE